MSMSNTNKRVKEIRRKTRRKFSSEENIRIVLDGLRGESSIADLSPGGHQQQSLLPSFQVKRVGCKRIHAYNGVMNLRERTTLPR